MNIFSPFISVFRFANTLGTVVMVGQVSWWCYKKYCELDAKKLRSSEIRERFVSEFVTRFGRMPTEEELAVTLRAADAVDRPLQHKMKEFFASLTNQS